MVAGEFRVTGNDFECFGKLNFLNASQLAHVLRMLRYE